MLTPRSAFDASPLKSAARLNLETARSSSDSGSGLFTALASSATTVMSWRGVDAVLPRQDWAQPVQWGARTIRFPGDGTTAGTEGQNLPCGTRRIPIVVLSFPKPESMGRFLSDTPQPGPQRHRRLHRVVLSPLRHGTDSYPTLKDRMALPHTATGRRMLKALQLGENPPWR